MKKLLAALYGAVATIAIKIQLAYAQASAAETYTGYVRQAFLEMLASARDMSVSAKLSIIAGAAIIAAMLYLRMRDTPANNLRKAREMHNKAVEHHKKGEHEKSAQYYQKAQQYRAKAEV
ncbi:hypothetical protein HYU12_00035 [Candidatus Woesearchaeota archaeon]|nr:hypothetical protein [Candidatus Woesearchaeota archaeon]